jgi:dolichol-phosphate mannosyltransferase
VSEGNPEADNEQAKLPARLIALVTSPTGLGRLVRFALVGLSGVFVDVPIFWTLTHVGHVNDLVAILPAYAAATLWNFTFNDIWTFRDRGERTRRATLIRLGKFGLVSLLPLAYRLATYWPLTRVSGYEKMLAYAIAIVVGMAWNFGVNFLWTWRKRSRDAQSGD